MTLLLPHGWEGLGPEHSSARLERFLQLCAQENMQVCNLSTPAQYFHMLRRQIKVSFRKPLIVMTPKSLLRHPMAISSLDDLSTGGFQPIIDDPNYYRSSKKILLCSGKIYYQLQQRLRQAGTYGVSIVRIEQLYPFPQTRLEKLVQRYPKAVTWTWVQEEPENMGAWHFIRPRIEATIDKSLAFVGRNAAASPATGFPDIYKKEQNAVIDQAIGPHREAPGVTA